MSRALLETFVLKVPTRRSARLGVHVLRLIASIPKDGGTFDRQSLLCRLVGQTSRKHGLHYKEKTS